MGLICNEQAACGFYQQDLSIVLCGFYQRDLSIVLCSNTRKSSPTDSTPRLYPGAGRHQPLLTAPHPLGPGSEVDPSRSEQQPPPFGIRVFLLSSLEVSQHPTLRGSRIFWGRLPGRTIMGGSRGSAAVSSNRPDPRSGVSLRMPTTVLRRRDTGSQCTTSAQGLSSGHSATLQATCPTAQLQSVPQAWLHKDRRS